MIEIVGLEVEDHPLMIQEDDADDEEAEEAVDKEKNDK